MRTLTTTQKRHLTNRIQRVKARIDNLETEHKIQNGIDEDKGRPLMELLDNLIIEAAPNPADRGDVSFDDLVDLLEDKLDELIELKNPIAEWASDLGIDIVSRIAVAVYKGTMQRVANRLNRQRAVLKRLQDRLKAGSKGK